MLEVLANYFVQLIYQLGYLGLIIAMTIESTFIPLPSELILLPAGYLWYKGLMNPLVIILCSILGAFMGSYFSYWLGEKLGRPYIIKHSKYFFLNEKRIKNVEDFFNKHGALSVFFARLIFGIRHYISFPAGFAKMNKTKFLLYTCLGSAIWSTFLTSLGYFIGTQKELVKQYIWYFTFAIFFIVCIIIVYYFFKIRKDKRK